MQAFNRAVERLALGVLLVGGVAMLASMFLGVADIVGTNLLAVPVPGPRELTESTMVLIVFGALAYAQVRRAHIRVELIYLQMPPRVQALMDVVAHLAALTFFGLLVWQAILELRFSLQIGEATVGLIRLPLWPARLILVLGVILLLMRLASDLAADLARLFAPRPVRG